MQDQSVNFVIGIGIHSGGARSLAIELGCLMIHCTEDNLGRHTRKQSLGAVWSVQTVELAFALCADDA